MSASASWRPPTRAQAIDHSISAAGAAVGIGAMSLLDSRLPGSMYGPPFGSIALLLFSAQTGLRLREMGVCTTVAVCTAQLVSLLGMPLWLTRAITLGLGVILTKMSGIGEYPPACALGLLFLERTTPGSLSLRGVLCPALTGHAILIPLAYLSLYARKRVALALRAAGDKPSST
jgi:hypothetical protein